MLLALCLILLAMNLHNSKTLEAKNKEIITLSDKQKETERRLDKLGKDIEFISNASREADASWNRLNDKIQKLEKTRKLYPEKVQELKNENEEIKSVLDTRLPDDLKRLLNESIKSPN